MPSPILTFLPLIVWKDWLIDLLWLTPLSAIFQLYHGDQFYWWKKPEYPETTTDHGQATGKLYHLRLRVECTFFCNLQSRARTQAVLVIGLYELLCTPTTYLIEPPAPSSVEKTSHHGIKVHRDHENEDYHDFNTVTLGINDITCSLTVYCVNLYM